MYLLYSIVLALALLVTLPYWLVQMLRLGKYRAGLRERLGAVPARLARDSRRVIWMHAVSVGEVLAVSRLVKALGDRYPNRRIVVSTTTATGQKLAREHFGEGSVFYFPLDLGFAIGPYLRALRPELVVIAETEFWPNFLRLARSAGARVAVVNARISDRSFPRYRMWRGLIRRAIAPVDIFLAQTPEDARRLVEIGAAAEKVRSAGNLKFDIAAPPKAEIVELLREGMQRGGAAHLVVCGSTVEGEEPHLLRTFRTVLVQDYTALMLLAPRHPERFEQVAGYLQQSGLSWWRRSHLQRGQALAGGVVLLDTIGELAAAYALATLAFVGGSLAPKGGHNILEAAQHGIAILVGPHTENFRDIVELFVRDGGARVTSIPRLDNDFIELLGEADIAKAMGERARATFQSQAGATERTLMVLSELMGPAR